MKTIALIALILGALGFDLHAQTPAPADLLKFHFQPTNNVAPGQVARPSDSTTNQIPLIQFTDVPITTGIENLARQAGLNYLLQPGLYTYQPGGGPNPEPMVSVTWKNITARDALDRLCYEHDLKLVDDPYTHIVRITRLGEPKYFIDGRVLGLSTNQPDLELKGVIPLILFSDVPLDTVLMNLIKQSGRPIELSSNLLEHVEQYTPTNGMVTFNLKLVYVGAERNLWFRPMPELSVRWENVTAEQCVIALCEAYDLELITNTATGNLQITPRKFKHRHHRVSQY